MRIKKYGRKGIVSALIKILNKEINNCACLRIERDNQSALGTCSQLGYEPQTSGIFRVIHATTF